MNAYLSRKPLQVTNWRFSAKSLLVPLIVAGAFLQGCVAPTVVTQPNSCASLLPSDWRQGVAGAPLPDGNTVGDWIAFGDAQTGKLDQANERTKASIGIIERCEARDLVAVKRATRRRFLGIL